MTGTRGGTKSPGQFRESQNWIGGRLLTDAAFVPPPVHEMRSALGNRFGPYLDLFADVSTAQAEIAEPQPTRY
jgi:hypothetical protein